MDGALGANNPVNEVKSEASDIWYPETELKPLMKYFISIGTGNPGKKAIKDRLLRFISKTLPELVTETEKIEKNFIARWRQHYDNKRYYRFNVEQGLPLWWLLPLAQLPSNDILATLRVALADSARCW